MPAPKDPQKLEEWKRKLSEKGKGRKTWNTGLKYSELPQFDEYREKLSKAGKGKIRGTPSDETRKKISDALQGVGKGKIVSEETRQKLSKAITGIKRSEETKRKISESKKGKKFSQEIRDKFSKLRKGRKGTPHTEVTKKKLSKISKDYWDDEEYRKNHPPIKHTEETKRKLSLLKKGKPTGYKLTDEHKRKLAAIAHLRKGIKSKADYSWRRGIPLSPETRKKISIALRKGHANGTIKLSINPTLYKSGFYQSSKAGNVRYRSSYELKVYEVLDKDDNVKIYKAEPFSIPYTFEEKEYHYYPDLLINYKDGSEKVVEIKPKELVNFPVNKAKHSAASLLLGSKFEIWSEDELTNLI